MAYKTGEQLRDEAWHFYGVMLQRIAPPLPDNIPKIREYIAAWQKLYQSAKNRQIDAINNFIAYMTAKRPVNLERWKLQLQRVIKENLHSMPPSIQAELSDFAKLYMTAIGTYQDAMDKIEEKIQQATEAIPRIEQALREMKAREAARKAAELQAQYVTTLQAEEYVQPRSGPGVMYTMPLEAETFALAEALKAPICIPQPHRGTYLPKQCQYPKPMHQWTDKEKQGFLAILQFINANKACFIQQPATPTSMADFIIWQPVTAACRTIWQKLHTAVEPKYHYFVMEQYLKAAAQMAKEAPPPIEEEPFYKRTWFLLLIAAVGIGGIYYYTRK